MAQEKKSALQTLVGNWHMGSELGAAAKKGARELGNAFGQAFPQQITVEQPGEMFNSTQMEVNQDKGLIPDNQQEVPQELQQMQAHVRGIERSRGMQMEM